MRDQALWCAVVRVSLNRTVVFTQVAAHIVAFLMGFESP